MVKLKSIAASRARGVLVVPACLSLLLSGCVPAVVAGGTAAGLTVAQERSVGNAIDDTGTDIAVKERLLRHDQQLFNKVGVEVIEGRVLLTGSVPTPEDRIEAARLAWQVDGVQEVINEIQVSDKSGVANFTKDAWITTQLRTKLITDGDVLDFNYNIETVNQTVYLIGIAKDQAELERATNHARNIEGVRRVISHVRLKSDPRRPG